MPEGVAQTEDPHRQQRLMIAVPAALLLGASGFFNAAIRLNPDGTHGPVFGIELARTLVLLFVALLSVWFAVYPLKPDPRIAQAVMLAGAVIAIVVGLEGFLTIRADATVTPGVAPYLQVIAAAGFLVLRWKRSLWPASRWLIEAQQAGVKGTASRRGK